MTSMASRIAEKMAGDILEAGKIKAPSGWLWQKTGSTLGSPETGFGKRAVTNQVERSGNCSLCFSRMISYKNISSSFMLFVFLLIGLLDILMLTRYD